MAVKRVSEPDGSKGSAFLRFLLFIGVLFGIIIISVNVTTTTAPSPADTKKRYADERAQNDCISKFDTAATGTGLVIGYKMEGSRPVVMVNDRMWNKVDFNVKSGVAETFDCAVAGPGKAIVGVQYISNMSGKVLHEWDGLKLIAK